MRCKIVQHTRLIKCVDDANTYLVNDISDPLQRSLTSLHLTDVLLGAPPPGASSTYAPASSALHPLICAQVDPDQAPQQLSVAPQTA